MFKNINSIIHMFPSFELKIDFLFETDDNFKDLCEDYLLIVEIVKKLKKENNISKKQLEEYADLQKDLNQEILQMIIR